MNRLGALHLDTTDVAAGERGEFVREAVSRGVNPLDLEHLQAHDEAIDMRLDAIDLGPLSVSSLRLSAAAAHRTPALARDDSPPSLFVVLKRSGFSTVIQGGRETVLGPGELFLLSSTRPSLVRSEEYNHLDAIQIPVEHLALPEAVLRQALALRLGPELPLASVLGRYIDSLMTVSGVDPAEADPLARAAIDLVRGLVTTVTGDPGPGRDSTNATLTLRLVDYLKSHWREHDLTADRVASAHHISTRQLYRLLAAEGISLGDWLRERRLEAVRDELARPSAGDTIAGVGRRWGFADATNFGRAFKSTYGLTPLEWRRLHQTAQP